MIYCFSAWQRWILYHKVVPYLDNAALVHDGWGHRCVGTAKVIVYSFCLKTGANFVTKVIRFAVIHTYIISINFIKSQ
jgi:hypothetical protein